MQREMGQPGGALVGAGAHGQVITTAIPGFVKRVDLVQAVDADGQWSYVPVASGAESRRIPEVLVAAGDEKRESKIGGEGQRAARYGLFSFGRR